MDFVESIRSEGVELERSAMGAGTKPKAPIIVEIDGENTKKDLDKLDIQIPVLSPRIFREYKNLSNLQPSNFGIAKIDYKQFSEAEQREIVFRDIATGEITHVTNLDSLEAINYQSVLGYFTQAIMKDLRLVSGYDVLYGFMKDFVQNYLFVRTVEIDNLNTLKNLSEIGATRTIVETFKKQINALTVQDSGNAEIRDYLKLRNTRPFVVKEQGYIVPTKSIFNKIIGDSHLELRFASFLEGCSDIVSYAKNYMAVHFKIDYVNTEGDISNYYPDFIVKKSESEVFIVETKGLEDLDVPLKTRRLKAWCDDINGLNADVKYDFVYVDEESFDKYKPASFADLVTQFQQYKGDK
jgi:type III restriction enzyme